MGSMYPTKNINFTNASEKYVYEYLKSSLPDKFFCYYNYYVDEKQMDFCIIVPELGFLIIEVKGWDGHSILRVEEGNTIYYLNKNQKEDREYSPFNQCRDYCFKLHNKIKKEQRLNIFVAPIVCYPNMTEEIYYQKHMNLISERNVTLLKDDFEDPGNFMGILLEKSTHISKKSFDKVTELNHVKLRKLFETEEEIARIKDGIGNTERKSYKVYYSKLLFIPRSYDINIISSIIHEVLSLWKSGVKVILLSEVKGINQIVYDQIKENDLYSYLQQYQDFQLYDSDKKQLGNRMFNFDIYEGIYDQAINEFEIIDGIIENESYLEVLKYFDLTTGFNFNQYKVEHANHERHILVAAGAGTGKTYSMISRISYLIYKNQFSPEDLIKSIYMITFTNDAANNMKRRLKKYFSNLFILTEDIDYISVMEMISKMNISTIDSLVKKIIQKYAIYLGVGSTISIESGVHKRREEIVNELNHQVEVSDKYLTCAAQYEKYELVKSVENLLDKLEKKNVDLSKEYNFGNVKYNQDLFKLLKVTAKNVQEHTISEDIKNNVVQLSNLMIYLGRILDQLENDPLLAHSIKYLFVDEFQDTDDFQIESIKRFQKLFGFHLFVVGDIKQCIYRFRGAEDNAFDLLLDGMSNWEKDFSLTKNYRTYNELLQEYHEHFSVLGDYLKYDKPLTGVKMSGTSSMLMNQLRYEDDLEFEKMLISKISELNQNLDDKESIAILTRTNNEIEKIRSICKKYNIEIETDMADNLYELESTIDLYKLVLTLQFNNNPKYLYNLSLTNYSRKISNRVVYAHRQDPNYITKLFMEDKIIPKWSEYVTSLKNEPIIRVLKKIINDIKPWNYYVHSLDLSSSEDLIQKKKHYKRNLDLLIETIIKRTNDEFMTINKIRDFLYVMIFAKQHEDEREGEQNGHKKLLCITVHKSKGLEYTHVILPFCDSELETINRNEMIVNKRDIGVQLKIGDQFICNDIFLNERENEKISKVQEETRILYVAMTRAEKTFTWFRAKEPSRKVRESWGILLERRASYEVNNI